MIFLARSLILAVLVVSSYAVQVVAGDSLLNIVYIMSDELAYYKLSHMGNKKIQAPRIDCMAKERIRFTRPQIRI